MTNNLTKQLFTLKTKNYIIMSANFTDGKYGQQDIAINPSRISNSPEIERIERIIYPTLKEIDNKKGYLELMTLKKNLVDSLAREYVGLSWVKAISIPPLLGQYSLPLNQFADFLNLLRMGKEKEILVYNKSGKKLDSKYLENIYSDIINKKNPKRGEWINNIIKYKHKKTTYDPETLKTILKGEFYLGGDNYSEEKFVKWGVLNPLKKEVLKNRQNSKINLENWIENPSCQGFPKKNILNGDLNYRFPHPIFHSEEYAISLNIGFEKVYLECLNLLWENVYHNGIRTAVKIN